MKPPKLLSSTIFTILFACLCLNLNAQEKNSLFDKVDHYHKTFPKEKIYLTLDKTNYNTGDTLWFKSFLLNADFSASTRTDKIYIELFNDSSKLIERKVLALNNGLGYGDIALRNSLSEGTYTLRAYSNWQQNFGTDYYFQKSFYLGKVKPSTWLIDSYQKLNTTASNKTLDLKIKLSTLDQKPAALRDVQVYLMNDKKRVMKAEFQTTIDGKIETTLPVSERLAGNYSFIIIDKKDPTRKATLPLNLFDFDEIDLQFMPEGGYLINNIYTKIAFKAIGADGLGKDIKGSIVNSRNENITEFASQHKGMGSFFLLAQKGESYTAVYTLNGKEHRLALPVRRDQGTSLRIDQFSKPDSVLIYVKANEDHRIDQHYKLLAQGADQVIMMLSISLKNGFSTLKLAKKEFSSGIIHFTLFSPDDRHLNQRSAYINAKPPIELALTSDRTSYEKRDSVSVEISATAKNGSPLQGTFSVSVTDDNLVKQEQDEENIISYFLLQSEIKGHIENPGWYFANQDQARLAALDHLLLTQAWIGYNWDNIFKPTLPSFKAERDNLVEGRLSSLFNKPVSNIKLNLLSLGKNVFFTDTLSDNEGKFIFKGLPVLDSAAYLIKIKNARGKTSTANIYVNEFTPSKEALLFQPLKPWYVNTDPIQLNYFKNADRQEQELERDRLKLSGNRLKEVEIKGKSTLKADTSMWDAKFLVQITEEDLKKTPRRTLYDLLKEQLPGLTISDYWAPTCSAKSGRFYLEYVVGALRVNTIIMDNISTKAFAPVSGKELFENHKHLFQYFNAEDVKDIKIYRGCTSYIVDIKTRSGNGPWMGTADGVYVHRPLPIHISKEFYSPKYNMDKSGASDLRSTIFWDANLITDANGKAKFSFYTADLPGTYTLKIEGTDLTGSFGFHKSLITIKGKNESK